MIEEISLREPFYSFPLRNEEDERKFLEKIEEFKKNLKEFVDSVENKGLVFVKVVSTENYEGSIAKVSDKDGFFFTKVGSYHRPRDKKGYKEYNYGTSMKVFKPRLTWDGLKNKIHPHLGELVWLKNYTGPTVLKRFDKKKEKENLLESIQLKDIEGNILSAGDPVLYINARYGGGMRLCRGKVVRFDASVNASRTETFTIVSAADNGEESKISNSEEFILKTSP